MRDAALSPAISDVELAARAMCKADGVDPDAMAYSGEPQRFARGYVPYGPPVPAWQIYYTAAWAAVNATKRAEPA